MRFKFHKVSPSIRRYRVIKTSTKCDGVYASHVTDFDRVIQGGDLSLIHPGDTLLTGHNTFCMNKFAPARVDFNIVFTLLLPNLTMLLEITILLNTQKLIKYESIIRFGKL